MFQLALGAVVKCDVAPLKKTIYDQLCNTIRDSAT